MLLLQVLLQVLLQALLLLLYLARLPLVIPMLRLLLMSVQLNGGAGYAPQDLLCYIGRYRLMQMWLSMLLM